MVLHYETSSKELNIEELRKGKFAGDVINSQVKNLSIITQGLFLNREQKQEELGLKSFEELIVHLYEGGGISSVLKGAYLVIIFDKESGRLSIFNDLLSKYSIYYYYNDGHLYLSDHFYRLVLLLKDKGIVLTVDTLACKIMASNAVFYDNLTYYKEIHYLKPFESLDCFNKLSSVKVPIPSINNNFSYPQLLDEIDTLFSDAVNLQNQKNQKNGYPTCSTLSGGMDSRTVFQYAYKLGYKEQLCYCYAETDSVDNKIASKIANDYDCKFYFSPIDKGNFILNRDNLCEALGGQMWYAGSTGTYQSLSMYNTDNLGIINAGIGGGEIMGDDLVEDELQDKAKDAFIERLGCDDSEKERINEILSSYPSYNAFVHINDLRRCIASRLVAKSFDCEYCSPFLDEGFFCLMLTVPFKFKKFRRLYVDWQKKYNPDQFKYLTTFWRGANVGNYWGYQVRRIYQYAIRTVFKRKTQYDMNPFIYWSRVNPKIDEYVNMKYQEDTQALQKLGFLNWIQSKWAKSNLVDRLVLLTITYSLRKGLE